MELTSALGFLIGPTLGGALYQVCANNNSHIMTILSLHLFVIVGWVPVTVSSCWFISDSICVAIPHHVAKHR